MDERENPMVRDECWPEYNSKWDDPAYLEWCDEQYEQEAGY